MENTMADYDKALFTELRELRDRVKELEATMRYIASGNVTYPECVDAARRALREQYDV